MSDAIEPRPSSPFVPERALTPLQVSPLDPLAGDWSEGLRGPVRALDVPAPLLLALSGLSHPAPLAAPASAPPVAPVADEVEAPDAWDAAVDDPLQSAPPPPLAGLPDVLPDLAPAAPAPAPVPLPLPGAPPAVAEEGIVELRAEDAADDAWSSPPAAAEPIQEWIPDAAGDEWQEVKKPEAPVLPDPPAPDWGTLSSGPDWTTAPAEAAPADAAWGMAPPPAAESAWDAVPAAPENPEAWEPPSLSAAPAAEWPAPETPEAPEAPEAPAAAAWNAPAVGASALEQLDSEPVEATPGAAAELFGSVPMGAALAAEDDELAPAQQTDEPVELGPSEELDPSEELGAPEELAAPEEVLRPVEDFDDPDLLVPIDEEEPPPAPPPQPLAMMQPASLGALAVAGEHRVAVHTRGGRTRRGSVRDIDLSKSQFPLIPQGGGAPEPVYHAEVKAIFFMLAPGEKPAAADGGKVRVTFADGRTIEGTRDGADAKHGFFLIPADAARTNTRRIYVAREATTDIKDG